MKEIERISVDVHNGLDIYIDGDKLDTTGITRLSIELDCIDKFVTIDTSEQLVLKRKGE